MTSFKLDNCKIVQYRDEYGQLDIFYVISENEQVTVLKRVFEDDRPNVLYVCGSNRNKLVEV